MISPDVAEETEQALAGATHRLKYALRERGITEVLMIEYKSGNLLDSEAEALVNTVNTVGVMGKGIALQFKQAFPDNFRAYEAACRHDEIRLGKMFVYHTGTRDGLPPGAA